MKNHMTHDEILKDLVVVEIFFFKKEIMHLQPKFIYVDMITECLSQRYILEYK